jgi:hypothetical protein
MRISIRALSGITAAMLASGVYASSITYYYSGEFTATTGFGNALSGHTFSGQFTYDPAASPTSTGGNFMDYDGSPSAMSVSAGSSSASLGGSPFIEEAWGIVFGALIFNVVGDGLTFNSGVGSATGDFSGFAFMGLWLVDANETSLRPKLSPLPTSLTLAEFTNTEFYVSDDNVVDSAAGGLTCLSAQASACSVVQTPEPATLGLLGLGLSGLAALRRRKE